MKLIMENWRELIYEEDRKKSRKELQTDLLDAVRQCMMLIKKLKNPVLRKAATKKLMDIWKHYGLKSIKVKGDAGKFKIWQEITKSHKEIKIQDKKTIEKMEKVRDKIKRGLFHLNKKQERVASDYAKQKLPQKAVQSLAIKTMDFGISAGKAAGKTIAKGAGLALAIPTLVIGYLDYKKARKDGLKSGYAVGSALWKAIPGVDFVELLNVMRDEKQDQQTINDLLKDLQNNPFQFKKRDLGIRKGKNLKKPLISREALEGAIRALMELIRWLSRAQDFEKKLIRKVNIILNRNNGKIKKKRRQQTKKKKTISSVPKKVTIKKAKPKILTEPATVKSLDLDCQYPKTPRESIICRERSWFAYECHIRRETMINRATVEQVHTTMKGDERKLFTPIGYRRWRSVITNMTYRCVNYNLPSN